MIIGNGDIASVLKDRENRVFFASGVSNSQETRRSEYEREKKLLLSMDRHRHIVYFSSLCVFYSDTLYAQHKRRMEKLIRENFKNYTIIRIGNITWGKNPNTIINFLKNKIQKGEPLVIQDVYRYVVDQEEFLYWVEASCGVDWNAEVNIPGRRMKVACIVEEIKSGLL